jgi:hypothetical protein
MIHRASFELWDIKINHSGTHEVMFMIVSKGTLYAR